MTKIIGVEYGRGATAHIVDGGPANAPKTIMKLLPEHDWTIIQAPEYNTQKCVQDRFGDCHNIQRKIYVSTPTTRHILIGGDHSVNFGHFAALADQMPNLDICLVYIDAHLDIHTPETSLVQASGAPHGTNVRALLGTGDARWLSLQSKRPALMPENLFYIGTRSFETAEIEFVTANNIFVRTPHQIKNTALLNKAIKEIRLRIANRPFVVSFDFDVIDPLLFSDVLVPEPDGISLETAQHLLLGFRDAIAFEFVEYAPSDKNIKCELIANQLIKSVL